MTIQESVRQRGIEEVLHFTTNKGLLGSLATGTVISRKRLPKNKYLEHVYKPNCSVRRDLAWLDYVNLSITRINSRLFDISSNRWHANDDVWWCVMSFDPLILTHDGVVFSTTNNMYSGVVRGKGARGLERLFSESVHMYDTRFEKRSDDAPSNHTTCRQAEVLYPGELSTKHLKRVFVATERHLDTIHGQLEVFDNRRVEVELEPMRFQ